LSAPWPVGNAIVVPAIESVFCWLPAPFLSSFARAPCAQPFLGPLLYFPSVIYGQLLLLPAPRCPRSAAA